LSNIRLTYSGLITFALLLVSIVTGLIFTLIVTRKLDQIEFGLWSLIGSVVAYSLIFAPISNYWVRRHIARGEEEAVTGIISALIFASGGIVIYFIATLFISEFSDSNYYILILAVTLVPFSYVLRSLNSIAGSYKPQVTAYSMLVFELTKIPLGYLLVYVADMGIEGAILTSVFSYITQVIVYVILLRKKLQGKFNVKTFRHWIKLSWLPVIGTLYDKIMYLDATIFTLMTGSVIGVAYVGISRVIGNLVSNTSAISIGLDPKLLATPNKKYVESMLDLTLLFAIPLFSFSIIFAKPGLWILNPIYVDGVLVVYLWSIIHLTVVIYGIFTGALSGFERVDVGFKAGVKQYLKSKLFSIPLVFIIGNSAYIVMLVVVFWQSIQLEWNVIDTIYWWGIMGVIYNVGILVTFWNMTSKMISFKFPLKKTAKYVLSAIATSIISHMALTEYLEYKKEIMEFIPSMIPHILFFIGMYFGLMLLLDKEFRVLVKQIFQELKKLS
jgi:O-antigen/teichoic acid export membrane protein